MTRHVYECPRRWGDLDAQGHVNNAVVIDYLQEARVHFLLTSAIGGLLDEGVIVVSHQIEYLGQIPFRREPIRLELWIDSVGAARFALSYELFDGDRLVARARTVVTPYDLAAKTIRRLRGDERAALQSVAEPPNSFRPLPRTRPDERTAFRYPCRVRWADMDAYGHVNNVKFFDYIQEGRMALVGYDWEPDALVMLVRQDLEYLKPMDFSLEPYQVLVALGEVGTTSATFTSAITGPDGVYATCRSVLVNTDLDGRPAPMPQRIRRLALPQAARL